MAHMYLTVILAVMLVMSQGVMGKRGCVSFGHSCFGGHGKRSAIGVNPEMMGQRQGQEETAPHSVYPHSGYGLLPSGDDIIPVRDGGVYDREESAAREVMKYKLHNIVKQWMDNYRRSQQTDDGYMADPL